MRRRADPLACVHTNIPSHPLPPPSSANSAPAFPVFPAYPPTVTDKDGKIHYKCPHEGCDKMYSGKHGRSIWRRHLQDKHNIPLSQQPRRTRWDSASNRPRSEAERRERTLESKRRWAKKNRAARKAKNQDEPGTQDSIDMGTSVNINHTLSSSSLSNHSSSTVHHPNIRPIRTLDPIKVEYDDRLSAHTPTPPSSSSLPLSFEASLATPPVPPPAHQPNISIVKSEHADQFPHFPPPLRRSPFKDLDANLRLPTRQSPVISDHLFKFSDRNKRPGPITSSPPRKHLKTLPSLYSPTPNSSMSLTPSLSPGFLSTPKTTPLRPLLTQKKRAHHVNTSGSNKESDHDAVFGLLALKTVSSPIVECEGEDDTIVHSVPSSPARFEFSDSADYGEKRMLGSPITETNRSIFQRQSSTPPSRKRVCDDLFNISGDDDCDYGKTEKLRYAQFPQLSSPAHPEMSKSLGLVPHPRNGISDQWYRPSPRRDNEPDTSMEY